MEQPCAELLPLDRVWCAIPVFNNRETVRRVAAACREILPHVVVVDDGSADADLETLLSGVDVTLLRHRENRGKGEAILTASRYVEKQGGAYLITIDADGQHLPEDIHRFLPLLRRDGASLIIGCRDFATDNVPRSSRFGRAFANFWLLVETGEVAGDCQSGFRAYPVASLNRMRFLGKRYDFEAEVLARAAWGGLKLHCVDIGVLYPKPEERVSSFKPLLDNLRLTRIHTLLVLRNMLPLGHGSLMTGAGLSPWRHPLRTLETLCSGKVTALTLARSMAAGMLVGVLPVLFLYPLIARYLVERFRCDDPALRAARRLSLPRFMPLLCVQVGYRLHHGGWLTKLSVTILVRELGWRLVEWLAGALIIAPCAALLAGSAMFVVASVLKKVRNAHV